MSLPAPQWSIPAENGATDETAEKVAGEIDAAGRTTVGGRRAADEAGGHGLCKECTHSDQNEPNQNRSEIGQKQERKPGPERRDKSS